MYIILAPNYFHIGEFRCSNGQAFVKITGQSVDAVLAPGGAPLPFWVNDEPVPTSVMTGDLEENIALYLTSEGQPYAGGVIVDDEEYLFHAHRLALLKKVKAKRNELWLGVAPTQFGPVNIDSESRDNIQGLLDMFKIAEELGAPIENIEFTMANDEDETFTELQFKQMSLAIGLYVNQVHRKKRDLQALIEAAETTEDLLAIDIETGWPA